MRETAAMVGLSNGCMPPGSPCLYPQPGSTRPPGKPGGRPVPARNARRAGANHCEPIGIVGR